MYKNENSPQMYIPSWWTFQQSGQHACKAEKIKNPYKEGKNICIESVKKAPQSSVYL